MKNLDLVFYIKVVLGIDDSLAITWSEESSGKLQSQSVEISGYFCHSNFT